MKTDIIGEAAKIIEDNPVVFDEEFLLEILKVRFRWPKKSIEVISNFGNGSEDFFDGRYNCIIFDKLEEYYPEHFPAFQQMILKNDIVLRENITSGVSDSLLEKMIDVCLTMEKPLENALGQDWRNIMTREKIKELLLRC